MKKVEIRAACSAFLRDAGIAKHWKPAVLDEFLGLAYDELLASIEESAPDYWQVETLITTDAAGSYVLPATFQRPRWLTQKLTLADVNGTPYDLQDERESPHARRANTAWIRNAEDGTRTLYVNPAAATTFALGYIFRPLDWAEVDENHSPAFPRGHYRCIAIEGACAAAAEGGLKGPGHLEAIRQRLRASLDTWVSRAGQAGPIVCQTADDG